MKKIVITSLMIVMIHPMDAQIYTRDTLQGIWQSVQNNWPPYGRDTNSFYLFKNKKLLTLQYPNRIYLSVFGFNNIRYSSRSIKIKYPTYQEALVALKDSGEYFLRLKKRKEDYVFSTPLNLFHMTPFEGEKPDSYQGKYMELFNIAYRKIDKLPIYALEYLFTQSQKDHRDYIAEFLELDVRRVKGDREPLYSDPYTVVDRLSKGTIVRVLGSEQKSGHVQIEYYNTENKIDTGFVIGSFLSTAIQDENGFDKPVASFDCQKSKSVVEQLICSDHHLGLLDIWLNDAYKQAKFFRPKELKSSQRAWIKERNGSIAKEQLPHQQRAILEKLYRERIAFLKEWE